MDLSKIITPVKSNGIEYLIIGGKRDGERGRIDKSIHTINGYGLYHKKQITCGGYTATFFVSSDLGDATPGEVMSALCHGYRKQK
ncbi:hypothetical protein FML35_19035 [Klebsiella oxytoca]|uniref:Uncharacterized protein n=1 Tax=Klebsiella oxytoca TaxID=571 RepID=A0AAI9GSE7_KLEOX|nr:hypothetical protein [Klebsiella oxytoca]ELM5279775.1 hypothetical protein [Klebsiella oxytoca]MBZ7278761.1 hypothetical protein [Klebsiella oxytoca]MBZ7717232.1 hypothetical protein [Klebsiella oxytoca]MCW9654047.1 hypothetical protein [Klebsiella oxytoca]MDM4107303.1 hypothetical protein [Klebsiella oxytoca]